MEEEGEAGSGLRGSVDVFEGEGVSEDASMEEGENASREGLVLEEDSNFEQQGGSGEKLVEPEGSVSQNPLKRMDAHVESTPILTPEKLQPEFVNTGDILTPTNETKDLEGNFVDHESTPYDTVDRQESIEYWFLESDDYSESAPTDNVSEVSISVKNYSTVDDEEATPQFDEKNEIVGKESEGDVMEIAERVLSQLRSIGKTAKSARKYILESDSDMEGLRGSNDRISDLLGPKRLDFEVIDFDQFGAQPPDLPVNRSLRKVDHHSGMSSPSGGKGAGASTKAKKPDHLVRVLEARNGFEQEMKVLNDSPVKKSLKNTPEKKQLRKEHGAGTLDLHMEHVIPRLCNMVHVQEGSAGPDVSRDLDSGFKPRLVDSTKLKKISEYPSGSPIKRSKSSMPDAKGSLVHEEIRKRTEELQQLTQMQAKRLEDYCHRVELFAAQLVEQSRMHENLNLKLEAECGERLKSEANLMVFCEMLPNVEEKLKHLCDQTLFMEGHLQVQVDLRNTLGAALERERQERKHFVAILEEQVDLRNKLRDDLARDRQEKIHLAAKLEEQTVDFRNKLREDLEQELREGMHLATKLEEDVDLKNKLEEALEREHQERMHFVSKLEEQANLRNKLGEELEHERQERLQLAAKLEEQVDMRNKLEEVLVQERNERMLYVAQMEGQIRLHGEIAYKLEDERLRGEADLMVFREMFPNMEEKLEDLNNQVESLVGQLQEQTKLREELTETFNRECKVRIQHMEDQAKMHAQLAQEAKGVRDERLKSDNNFKELCERLPTAEEKLNDLQNQVLLVARQLQEQIELRKELEERLDSEREERTEKAVTMSNRTSESLPALSTPWSLENVEFAKFLDEQRTLLANQVKEAEVLKNASEKKVGLVNHQVQNLEAVLENAVTTECAFSAKERAIRQTIWTLFQALCVGMGLLYFIVSLRNPVRSFLQPT